jgi:hypothetical protein
MVEEVKKSKGGFWKYVLIVFVIIVGYQIFFANKWGDNLNSSYDNLLASMKGHIVYVLYDFSGKNADGSYFEKEASGSGAIFYTNDSMVQIFTNRHVIDCGYTDSCYQRIKELIKVRMPDGKIFNVSEVLISPHGLDIAVLTIEGNGLKTYSPALVRKNEIQLGEKVTVIGYPAVQGINNVLELSVSSGTITNFKDLLMKDGFSFKAIDSDAYTNYGSSGGGLFDSEGNLIGITTWKSIGVQESTAININVIDNFDKYFYCSEGSYPLQEENICAKYCKREEVLGKEGLCYGVCSGFYCESEKIKGNDDRCKEGYIYGNDGYCHLPCGSDLTYCSSTDSICFKDKCVNSCSLSNQELFKDGTCRVYE